MVIKSKKLKFRKTKNNRKNFKTIKGGALRSFFGLKKKEVQPEAKLYVNPKYIIVVKSTDPTKIEIAQNLKIKMPPQPDPLLEKFGYAYSLYKPPDISDKLHESIILVLQNDRNINGFPKHLIEIENAHSVSEYKTDKTGPPYVTPTMLASADETYIEQINTFNVKHKKI